MCDLETSRIGAPYIYIYIYIYIYDVSSLRVNLPVEDRFFESVLKFHAHFRTGKTTLNNSH